MELKVLGEKERQRTTEEYKMIRLKQLDSEYLETVMAFDKLNFPTDFWKAADWKDLMEDERALYYAFLDEENLD